MNIDTASWESSLVRRAHFAPENMMANEPVEADQQWLEQAYARCETVTRQHSRTFHMASALLPAAKREAVRALYAFCRISDDLVDEGGANRTAELARWRQESLQAHPHPDNLVALAWADARARYGIPRQYAEQLLDGVAADIDHLRYQTFEELAHYCYGVASTVGLMSMHIVGYASDDAIPYAIKLGVALQLTNILRDVGEDWQRGRFYLPLEEMAAFGLAEAELPISGDDPRWVAFMQFQIERTRQLYREALPGIGLLDVQGRFAIAAAAELYQGILDDIEANQYDVFNRRAHVSDLQKLRRLPGIWWRSRFGHKPERR
jgi:15-cis-phytoene synthase